MDEYKIKLCGHIGEQRQYKVVGNPDMPDGDYVLLSEAQAEIDHLKAVVSGQARKIEQLTRAEHIRTKKARLD